MPPSCLNLAQPTNFVNRGAFVQGSGHRPPLNLRHTGCNALYVQTLQTWNLAHVWGHGFWIAPKLGMAWPEFTGKDIHRQLALPTSAKCSNAHSETRNFAWRTAQKNTGDPSPSQIRFQASRFPIAQTLAYKKLAIGKAFAYKMLAVNKKSRQGYFII